ncbi:undecaprenyl-phosphate glucose phosphotransferase [Duganella sp. FT80W]|uniref:Undecaprenyl-phosphate glucose phosphotransferase n=1 Tax=Duganella guangzhouensis TaxID=2666084 RepID=A0A6I2KY86_9BURK|nr:undecaprenyl-phosphate glucose phosphotransferase [Duganella guangzhouensis]MRW89947.1 undecaprenyl-phosphate glucose phosphotransferase [Duganella guangzhouensis]
MRIPFLNDTERLSFALRLGDLALLTLAGLGAGRWQSLSQPAWPAPTPLWLPLCVALGVALLPRCGLYLMDLPGAPRALLARLLMAWLGLLTAAMLCGLVLEQAPPLSALWLGRWLLLALAPMWALHMAARGAGVSPARVLVIGHAAASQTLCQRHRRAGAGPYQIIALCLTDGATAPPAAGIERIDRSSQVPAYVGSHAIDQIWIVLPLSDAAALARLQHLLRNTMVHIRWLQDLRDLQVLNLNGRTLYDFPVLDLNCMKTSAAGQLQKYLFDKAFALLALVLLAPLMLLIALAIKSDSKGPALFVQPRIGLNGRQFNLYKFRSMRRHAAATILQQAGRDDPRVTRLGRWLRRTSLDELPQFFNVLRGDMSVVGPRPHAVSHTELYCRQLDVYMVRHRAKPGITGWAQINGARGETDTLDKMIRRVQLDLYYLQHWSLWLDLRIVLWTACKGWTGNNVY